ncbi:hypothetical protein MSG28_001664 [Choristoneura fumiferana]|uniref:Uncharacterized protein n=1 Tax=Choristoneura fumiferana TaxID=7141 RepID=A0ACC0KVI3_CHOFU|nr:hypothetical protein MSG28_001664 [Choristoneura fumiferana]
MMAFVINHSNEIHVTSENSRLYNKSIKRAILPEAIIKPLESLRLVRSCGVKIRVVSFNIKVFESAIHARILPQVSEQLSDEQHGFRPGRSTASNLLNYMADVLPAVDSGVQVDAAYFDYKKAFDLVDNDILLRKLAAVGFTPHLLEFFASYMKDRRQYVEYAEHTTLPPLRIYDELSSQCALKRFRRVATDCACLISPGNRFHRLTACTEKDLESHLECNAIIWAPHEQKYKRMVERVQNKYLRYLYLRYYGVYPFYPLMYPTLFVLGMVGYNELGVRRDLALVTYIWKILRGVIKNADILGRLGLYVPERYVWRRRRPRLLAEPRGRTNLLNRAPLTRAIHTLNKIAEETDLFLCVLSEFTKCCGSVEYLYDANAYPAPAEGPREVVSGAERQHADGRPRPDAVENRQHPAYGAVTAARQYAQMLVLSRTPRSRVDYSKKITLQKQAGNDLKLPLLGSLTIHDGGTIIFDCEPDFKKLLKLSKSRETPITPTKENRRQLLNKFQFYVKLATFMKMWHQRISCLRLVIRPLWHGSKNAGSISSLYDDAKTLSEEAASPLVFGGVDQSLLYTKY